MGLAMLCVGPRPALSRKKLSKTRLRIVVLDELKLVIVY